MVFALREGNYTGEIVNKMEVDGSIVSATHYSTDESSRDWHYHENLHISFVFQGGESETRRSTTQNGAGGVFFYPAGEKHRWISQNPVSKSANIEIGPAFYKKFGSTESQIARAIHENLDLKFLMLQMQQELFINDNNSFAAIQSLLLELVNYSKTLYNGKAPRWVGVLNDLLNDRWQEKATLQELSLAIGVHPVTISKYFRKYFYCTLGEYLRKLKIDKSIPLIKNSRKSLTEIAFHCGFADQSHFTRTFKHLTGLRPKAFRNM